VERLKQSKALVAKLEGKSPEEAIRAELEFLATSFAGEQQNSAA
jgi:ribosomal protein L12E/L44/L45/RPP1/RPP2